VGYHSFDCIDVGTENCPCYLAVTGDCLICSRLQGKEICDCHWKGVCIYNEYMQGNGRVNNPRVEFPASIVKKKYYLDDLIVFTLDVGKGFALKASRPGSYIFLRGPKSNSYYDTPICVMKTDPEKGELAIAVKIISAKTKTLAEAEDFLTVRGIYRNGILGIDAVTGKEVRGQKILVVAKGTGLAPGMLAANHLWHRNRVDWVIDPEKISEDLICDFFGEGEGIIKYRNLSQEGSIEELLEQIGKESYDAVLLLTSDYFLQEIGTRIRSQFPKTHIATSNNFHICCGEGVCGACSMTNSQGETFKMCKCQSSSISFDRISEP
jgi:hypothetical protein